MGEPFSSAAGLSFTGFFFPLLRPMLRVGGNPVVRQQGFQRGSVVRGDSTISCGRADTRGLSLLRLLILVQAAQPLA